LETPDCIKQGRDPWNDGDDDDDEGSAGCAGHAPCADTAAVMAGRVDGPLKLDGGLTGRAWMVADDWPTRYVCNPCANLLKGISAKTRRCTTYLDGIL